MCILATAIYGAQSLELSIPRLINNYFNDLICMPFVLKICQYTVRIVKSDSKLTLPTSLQVVVTLIFSIYFEFILPIYNPRYTSDWVDVIMYFLGLLIFITIERQSFYSKLTNFAHSKKLD